MATKLKRTLGVFETTLYGVGVILGAGIYALIGKAAGLGGNAVWLSFLLCAILAAFTGLSYAELSSIFPKAGGEYVYIEKAFNRRLAFLVGWLILVGGVISAATVALGFGNYFNALFHTPILPVACLLIFLLTLLNLWGIKESSIANIVATLIEAGGLIIIIALGLRYMPTINYFELPPGGFTGVISATALIFFAYLGFEDIVRLSEEAKNPTKTIPKSLVLAIIISTILYVLTAAAAVAVVGWEKLAESQAPLALVAQTAFGAKAFFILSIIALFATFNTVLVILIATSRMLYGMAENHGLPKIFANVHKKFKTPWVAVLLVGLFSAIFLLIKKIEIVASLTDFALLLTFALVNASLLYLRYKSPNLKRPFKTYWPLAIIGLVMSIYLLFHFEKMILLGGLLATLAGLGVYEIIKKKV
ncbi:MAG: amino acid permease [Candidatus Nanoarchaeia archaeon]